MAKTTAELVQESQEARSTPLLNTHARSRFLARAITRTAASRWCRIAATAAGSGGGQLRAFILAPGEPLRQRGPRCSRD